MSSYPFLWAPRQPKVYAMRWMRWGVPNGPPGIKTARLIPQWWAVTTYDLYRLISTYHDCRILINLAYGIGYANICYSSSQSNPGQTAGILVQLWVVSAYFSPSYIWYQRLNEGPHHCQESVFQQLLPCIWSGGRTFSCRGCSWKKNRAKVHEHWLLIPNMFHCHLYQKLYRESPGSRLTFWFLG